MYRVVLYSLMALVAIALVLSATKVFAYSSFFALSASLGVILVTCFIANVSLSKIYKVTANHESTIITSLILFFVLGAPSEPLELAGIIFAALVAVASKYVVTWNSAHIFNPAAFGVLVVSILGIGNGVWWIADKAMFIPMLIFGYIILLKLRRFELFFAFLVPAVLITLIKTIEGSTLINTLYTALTLYPVIFLGSIMLTEPNTMPATRYKRILFGMIVGIIFALNADLGFISTSPHLALIIGNLFAFYVTARVSSHLKLVDKVRLTPTTYSYAFEPSRPIHHEAGQYMELTIPGVKFDSRGNRRTFTIASPPHEKLIKIGVKFYDKGSAFKSKLRGLKIGDSIMGNHVAGDFTLDNKSSSPVVFVAGGIGITPFIAMIEDILARGIKRQIDLYYFTNDQSEVAYKEILKKAQAAGISIHLRAGKGLRLTDDDIKNHASAHFYLSGPPGLVNGYKARLKKLKVKHIHTDLFTGY